MFRHIRAPPRGAVPKGPLGASTVTFKSVLTVSNVFKRPQQGRGYAVSSASATSNHSSAASQQVLSRIPEINKLTSKVNKQNLPYYQALMSFDDCLTHNSTFDSRTGRIVGSTNQFWESVRRAVPLYDELMATGEINQQRMDEYISMLRNGLRVHRWELTRLRKNLDRDVHSPLQQMHDMLQKALVQAAHDLVNEHSQIGISSRGVTNLFKAFKDMGLADEAAQIWNKGKNVPRLYDMFTAQSVLGAVFSLFVENNKHDFNFNEVWSIYSRIREETPSGQKVHGELQVSMVRACLLQGRIDEALKIFTEISTNTLQEYQAKGEEPPLRVLSYMTTAHLSFIGYCTDYDTARVFFDGVLEGDLPYETPLQISVVRDFMRNTYNSTHDIEKVKQIWLDSWRYYEANRRANPSMSSSLNGTFLDIFFERYPKYNDESTQALKGVLEAYHSLRHMDEPFFNCLLTRSMVWHNTPFLKSILQAADMYNFPKTSVFFRCALKSSKNAELVDNEIFDLFRRLLDTNVGLGARNITNADWFAVRDATIRSQNVTAEKIDLYFKLWKMCAPYFLSMHNLKMYVGLDIKENRAYGRVFRQLEDIDASDIALPQLRHFQRNRSIDNYYMEQGITLP